jgi:hypothetical protein
MLREKMKEGGNDAAQGQSLIGARGGDNDGRRVTRNVRERVKG